MKSVKLEQELNSSDSEYTSIKTPKQINKYRKPNVKKNAAMTKGKTEILKNKNIST